MKHVRIKNVSRPLLFTIAPAWISALLNGSVRATLCLLFDAGRRDARYACKRQTCFIPSTGETAEINAPLLSMIIWVTYAAMLFDSGQRSIDAWYFMFSICFLRASLSMAANVLASIGRGSRRRSARRRRLQLH